MGDQLSKEEQNALDVVKKMYAAFAKGDMNAVLDSRRMTWSGTSEKGTGGRRRALIRACRMP